MNLIKLEIGCGINKTEGYTGIDVNPDSHADIIHDLNTFPYPFKDNEIDAIKAFDVLEHLDDVLKVMEELHRISRNGTFIEIRVPFPSGTNYPSDPTHKRAFTSRSFDYFIPGKSAYDKYAYSNVKFRMIECEYERFKKRRTWYQRHYKRWANKYKSKYEEFNMYKFQIEDIYFKLEVLKDI